jgi:GDPmannose 4,6-dehydratase
MKVLITGIYGQDGQIIEKKLNKKNLTIIGFVKRIESSISLNKKTIIFEDDLSNFFHTAKNLKKIQPNIILHFACNNVNSSLENNFYRYYLSNVASYLRLFISYFLFCKKAKFIFAGSSMMYDKYKEITIDENTNFNSKSHYGIYKIHCHKISLIFKKIFKLKYTTAILFNHDSKFRNENFLLPRLIMAIKKNNYSFIKEIYKNNINFDSSHADDICEAIIKIMLSNLNLDKVIISSGKITRINDIIKKLLNNKNIIFSKAKRNFNYILGDCRLLKDTFGYKPKKNTMKAIQDLWKFLKI